LSKNLVINRFVKHSFNKGETPCLSFWRDKTGNEIDLLHQNNNKQYAYEIKAGATYSLDFFKGLSLWANLSGASIEQCNAVYGGDKLIKNSYGNIIPWQQLKINE
jgi:predicted AAA+ superfamily ATPase